ncbi:MAG: DUF3014 domain-containing protein [Betaproteobacteria bacterium]|nr:DUF3014 domain-containing protein [Betaproteobacteria bacterium]
MSPLKPAPGKFAVAGADAQMAIAPQNAARYAPLVRAFEAVNSRSSSRSTCASIRCSRRRTASRAIRTRTSTTGSCRRSTS